MGAYLTDYKKMMLEVKTELHHRPELANEVETYIERLEQQKRNAQDQYIDNLEKLKKLDYECENANKANEHLGNTLKLYEVERSALKEVVRAHGQLAAVLLT
jgi:hypothetical protein